MSALPSRSELEKAAQQSSDNAIEFEHCADVLFARDEDSGEEHPEFCARVAEHLTREAEKQWTMCAGFWAQAKHRGGAFEERGLAKPEHSS